MARSRDWGDVSINQRAPRIASDCRKLEEARQEGPLESREGVAPDTLTSDSQLPGL